MTREETIKGLKSLVEVRRKYFDMQTMKDEIECLDMAIKALEQQKAKWIPMTERLPKKSGTYLVTMRVKPFCIAKNFDKPRYNITTYAYYFKRENQWTPDDEWEDDEIVAWMPLPEPYKPESEVEK